MATRFDGTDRFQVVRQLGVGGFGVVYEVLDRERDTHVALKVLTVADPAALLRFKREFRIFADLRHENLVALHELFSEGETWFFTMDLVEGSDWLTHVRTAASGMPPPPRATVDPLVATARDVQNPQGVLVPTRNATDASDSTADSMAGRPSPAPSAHPWRSVHEPRLRASLVQVVRGLRALHATGSCHRDIKPSNIRVSPAGRAVVLDLGIASSDTHDVSLTDVNAVLGTPAYMAPEQAVSSAVTPAADWYALGVMLYEALTGELPFTGSALQILGAKQFRVPSAPSQRDPSVPADLDALCVSLLQTLPEKRPDGDAILECLGATPDHAATPHTPRISSGAGAFVGREALLGALGEAYTATRGGRMNAVFLHGTSGMGKSTLVNTFLQRAEGSPVVLAGRCLQRESVPYKAFDSVIDGLSRHLLALSPPDAAGLMPRDAAALSRVFPVLDRVPAVAASPRKVAELRDPVLLRSKAFVALRELFSRMTDRRPLVVFLDDLQWGDTDSAWLLAELLAPPDPPPVLYVLSYRTEDADASVFLGTLHRRLAVLGVGGDPRTLDVGVLSPAEAFTLARTLLHRESDALARSIAHESLGSPFFVGELVQYAQHEAGRRVSSNVRLDDVVRHRVELLPSDARTVLRLVSLAGHGVDRRVVLRAAGITDESLALAVGVLRVGRLIKLSGARGALLVAFHDRIREVVVDTLTPDERAAHHRSLALAFNALDEADPETLLAHFRGAGMIDQARKYARLAAERAAQALAFDRAAEILGEALALDGWDEKERWAMARAHADALVRAGRGVMAAPILMRLAESQDPVTAMDLQRQAGEQYLLGGQIARGTEIMALFLRRVRLRMPGSLAMMLVTIALMRAWIGLQRWDRALPVEPAIPELDRLRLDLLAAYGRSHTLIEPLTMVYFVERFAMAALRSRSAYHIALALCAHEGVLGVTGASTLETVAAQCERALAMVDRDPRQPELRLFSHVRVGGTAAVMGRSREGLNHLDAVLDPTQRVGSVMPMDLDLAMVMAIKCCYDLGEYQQLVQRMRPYLHDAMDRSDLLLSTTLRVGEGSVRWMVQDQCAAGRMDVQEALDQWGRTTFDNQRWWGGWSLGTFDLYEGLPDQGHARMVALLAAVRSSRLRINHTQWAITHLLTLRSAVARLAVSPLDPARQREARQRLRTARRLAAPCDKAMALLLEGGLACVTGQKDHAIQLWTASRHAAGAVHQQQYVAFCNAGLGALQGGPAGEALRSQALGWLRDQGVRNPARFIQAFAPGLPDAGD